MVDERGSAAGGLGVGADGSAPPPSVSALSSPPAAGVLPTVTGPAEESLMRQLIDMGIPATTAAAAIEAEEVRGLGTAAGDAFDDRVMHGALATCVGASASGCRAGASAAGARDGGTADDADVVGPAGGGRVVGLGAAAREDDDVVVISDGEELMVAFVGGATGATDLATAPLSASGNSGTHKQTAADIQYPSSLALPAGTAVQVEGGMTQALTPVAVSHRPPELTADPTTTAMDVSLVADAWHTRGSGVARAAVFFKIFAAPG